jgi:uncharacterized GH25 family protein
MKKLICVFLVFAIAIVALAHEFWLQPQTFIYKVGDIANIKFNVGENFIGENWKGNRLKVQQLLHYTPNGEAIEIAERLSNTVGDSLQLPLTVMGTHMVTYQSKNSFIQLDASKFNAYLQEDGLADAIAYRKTNREDTMMGKEYYQRSVKTILQCGNQPSINNCTQPTTLPLDIVPLSNPYQPQIINQTYIVHQIGYTVYFKNKPLPKILVRYWCKQKDGKLITKQQRTNKKGRVSFEHEQGETMISCVQMERYTADASANWQSYWASVTFNYQKGNFFKRK